MSIIQPANCLLQADKFFFYHVSATSDDDDPSKRAAARLGTSTSNLNILPDLSSHMRQLMRLIPHPVAVVTASSDTTSSEPAASTTTTSLESTFRGMTISSFNTVTLSPTPIVSFNVRIPSATFTAMSSNKIFLVHLLSSSATGARIAEAFTKGNNEQGDGFRTLAMSSARDFEIFAGRGTQGAPLISSAGGVMQVLKCRILPEKMVEVTDHKIVVAEVLGIVSAPAKTRQSQAETAGKGEQRWGLMYGDRRYRGVGPEVSPEGGDGESSTDGSRIDFQQTQQLNLRRGDEAQRGSRSS
ncbi:MAG: hypothetical protein M1831_006439 [Alyxoria varia]|nr:MAG: hypothetical protein M1831_006439 [Alyxoria varia]